MKKKLLKELMEQKKKGMVFDLETMSEVTIRRLINEELVGYGDFANLCDLNDRQAERILRVKRDLGIKKVWREEGFNKGLEFLKELGFDDPTKHEEILKKLEAGAKPDFLK